MPVYIILSDESPIRVQLAHIYTVLLLTLFPFPVQILNSRPGKTSFRSASGFNFIFLCIFCKKVSSLVSSQILPSLLLIRAFDVY